MQVTKETVLIISIDSIIASIIFNIGGAAGAYDVKLFRLWVTNAQSTFMRYM